MAFKFESLRVWQLAMDLNEDIYLLSRGFPKEERYILTNQILRATDSIALNIAEGSTGQTNKEFKKFIGYSIRSIAEVVGCLYIGRKRGIIEEKDFYLLYEKLELLMKMLQSLRNRLT